MIPFPSSHRKLFAILIDMWAMIGVVCWAVASRNHPPIDRHIQREDCTVTTKGYSSSLGASACHHWFLKPIPEFFSPSNPVIFPCIVSKESLMSLVRNIPFETAVSPKLSHPMHKKDCLQPVVLPEWSLGAGPALFQKYQQHRVFKKTCLLWWARQWKYIVIPGSFWVLLRNWWMTDWDFPDFQQAIKPL